MNINYLKVGLAAVIALACIVALALDADGNYGWAAPVLTLCVGYVIGNAQVTSQTGNTAPIVVRSSVEGE